MREFRNAFLLAVCAGVLLHGINAYADVTIVTGPTSIPRGDASGANDITVSNGIFAVAFAVDSAPPWGVARGGIVDIAILEGGEPGYDIASLADFMPNNWSSWPTTYQRVTVDKKNRSEVVVTTLRDWGDVALETTFRIRDGDSRIHIVTEMTNLGDEPLAELLTGYVVWPDGGYLVDEPIVTAAGTGERGGWTAAYDEGWLVGLHAPFSDYVTRRGRDRYTQHVLQPFESRRFEAWLQIEPRGELAPMVATEIEFGDLAAGRIEGRVRDSDGGLVAQPAVVVAKAGKTIAWTLGEDGEYSMQLPEGDYELYATARGYARGASKRVSVTRGRTFNFSFDDVQPPGRAEFKVIDTEAGGALDARISVKQGYKPLIGYFGKSTFFTELDSIGELAVDIAPGDYEFEISAGGGFLSAPVALALTIAPGERLAIEVEVPIAAVPQAHGWFSADLHHHSDVLDGFTEAEYVLRSELAAGVDIAFLSDHDSVQNNELMRSLAADRGVPFIPGTELSPSWGHFNAYPLDDGVTVEIDTGRASVQEIFAAARDMGADAIAVNHPYSDYGYFENLEKEAVPGGLEMGFDLVEIGPVLDNRGEPSRNTDVIERVWKMWNENERVYLAAGSDVHDVWVKESARIRTFVYVDGELSIEKFIAGLKAGHAYASQGPLVYPEILFGSELQHLPGTDLDLRYVVQAVAGLRAVKLIEKGRTIDTLAFDEPADLAPIRFSVRPEGTTWYSLVIEDDAGRTAFTNPVWVNVTN